MNTVEKHKNRFVISLIVMLVFFTFPSPLQMPLSKLTPEAHAAEIKKVNMLKAAEERKQLRVALAHRAVDILHLQRRSNATLAGLSSKQADALVVIYEAFGKKHFTNAVRIAYCESKLNPKAINRANRNGTTDRGLFQLNDGGTMQRLGVKAQQAFDPTVNARAARVLFEDRGWQPWSCQYVYRVLDKYKAKDRKADARAAKNAAKATKTAIAAKTSTATKKPKPNKATAKN
jgi:hypothetical protein